VLRAIVIAAPLLLALSIGAYLRIRRHLFAESEPIATFRNLRWNSFLIAAGGVFLLRGAQEAQGLGPTAQLCGFLLALEFFYVAFVNVQITMGDRGILVGMSYSPWPRFVGYDWPSDQMLELRTRSRRRYRFRVPAELKDRVAERVEDHIPQQ
jgi:hypothetical protein